MPRLVKVRPCKNRGPGVGEGLGWRPAWPTYCYHSTDENGPFAMFAVGETNYESTGVADGQATVEAFAQEARRAFLDSLAEK